MRFASLTVFLRQVAALVLTPTAELAQQVLRVAKDISAGGAAFRSAIITGEHKWATQKQCAKQGLELLIATPGRLRAHLEVRAQRPGSCYTNRS